MTKSARYIQPNVLMMVAALLLAGEPYALRAAGPSALHQGAESAERAASFDVTKEGSAFLFTEHLFQTIPPDTAALAEWESEKEEKHLARDIAVFVIVSAFVGYFIAKVFIEGEKEEPPPENGGKHIPTASPILP